MGLGHLPGATPTAESASLYLELWNFLDAALIEVTRSNLEPLTRLVIFFDCGFIYLLLFFLQFTGNISSFKGTYKKSFQVFSEDLMKTIHPWKNFKECTVKKNQNEVSGSKY
jgi:hypothetical protein